MWTFGTFSLIVGVIVGGVLGQVSVDPVRGLCNSQLSCRECILANPNCVWCADMAYNLTRCYASGDPMFAGACPPLSEQRPGGEVGESQGLPLGGLVQVFPSRISLSVRPGATESFTLNVRPANNFPIDLYLLMDLSFSMEDDLDNLKRLGSDLTDAIVELSTNFRLGFGSFVEKVVGPFTSLNPNTQRDPCGRGCEATYSYRHVISLTDDAARFNALVQQQEISGNQDLPEGGFDGFLQSLVCTDLIGWRNVSRKLLLYITDAGFHFAGDGKLGGILLPHQSVCRMPTMTSDVPVDLPEADVYDYPSVGQIAQALRDRDIIPIFAAEERVMNFYDELVAELGEGAFVGTLESNSNNVVDLVRTQYLTISQRVIFDQARVPGVTVSVNATECPQGFIDEDRICNGLNINQTATFNVSVSISECTPEIVAGVNVPVRVLGFGTLDIQVSGICQCPCENITETNSTACTNRGALTCGQCECNAGTFGARCQCDAENQQEDLACPLGNGRVQCSAKGTCLCGVCTCEEGFFGPACECAEEDCVIDNQICSGRGTCGCNGQCMCELEPVTQRPYEGINGTNLCQCTPNNQNCRDPSNRTEDCNGRGTCGCEGTCECREPYSGAFCELCTGSSICVVSNCESNQECANCILDFVAEAANNIEVDDFFSMAMQNLSSTDLPAGYVWSLNVEDDNQSQIITLPMEFCSVCTNGAVILSGTESTDYTIDGEMTLSCPVIRDGCSYRFFVGVDLATTEFTSVHVSYNRTCTQAVGTAPWVIALSILIPLLVLGFLLLLLLKLLLLLLDYVEVRRFERDIKNTKYSKNENPLYRSATKDYQNPLYGQ